MVIRLLTLPSGERLRLPDNVRLIFEVENLRYATPATVSRCGMVWFSDDVVTFSMEASYWLQRTFGTAGGSTAGDNGASDRSGAAVRRLAHETLAPMFKQNGPCAAACTWALQQQHIMSATRSRMLLTLFSGLHRAADTVRRYQTMHTGFTLSTEVLESYVRLATTACTSVIDSTLQVLREAARYWRVLGLRGVSESG